MTPILIIVASIGANMELAETIHSALDKRGHEAEIIDIVRLDLPLYTQLAEHEGIPEEIPFLVDKLSKSTKHIYLCPEYNGGIPPSLSNFIAWVSRGSGEDWKACFNGKTMAIGTHSGATGTHVLNAMRSQLAFLGGNVIGRQISTSYEKKLNPETLEQVLDQLL